jgi:glycine dehydrogenase
MLKKLEHQLNVITGFAGTTLQPNSGAQGEYANDYSCVSPVKR